MIDMYVPCVTCGSLPTLVTIGGKRIRGLHVCQNEDCKLLQNRDRTGALTIGVQFQRVFRGEDPIRAMTQEMKELTLLHRRYLDCSCEIMVR